MNNYDLIKELKEEIEYQKEDENFTNEEYTSFDLASEYLGNKVYHNDYLEILNAMTINSHNWNKIIEIIYEELVEFIEEEDLLDEEGE
jgi:hypothetical protein